jgi:hypothetical protein
LGKANREAERFIFVRTGWFSVFKKDGGVIFILRLVLRSKPAGARERAKPMGGAPRRPDKSEMGAG